MNFLENNKKEKFKILLLFILLFLMFPITVNAGRVDQMEQEKPIVKDEAKDNEGRLNEYCSYVSSKETNSEYGKPDSNAIMDGGYPKAPLIDTINWTGRNNTSIASEDVLEYEGFYYFDIKRTLYDGTNFGGMAYARRTYFKFVELKKEVRGA